MYIKTIAIAIHFGLPWYYWYHKKKPELKFFGGTVGYNFTVEIYKEYIKHGKSLIMLHLCLLQSLCCSNIIHFIL